MTNMTDLAIIGGGPGGFAGAKAAISHGLCVTILDEQARPGGQIYRQPFSDEVYPRDRFGGDHVRAQRDASDVCEQSLVTWRGGASVWGLVAREDAFDVFYSSGTGSGTVRAKRVLIAAGCHDMAVPFPGWTLPGVMGAGGIQAMLKGQGVVPGKSIVLGGSHPLLLVVAAQLLDFGVQPKAVLFSQSRLRAVKALSRPMTALGARSIFAQGAQAYRRLRKSGVPVCFGRMVTRADGDGALSQITVAPTGSTHRPADPVACDTFGYCYGFTSSSELPRQLGAKVEWSQNGGGWIVTHDPEMQTSVPGLYVAGETAGVGGMPCARAEGTLAGLAIARSLGVMVPSASIAQARKDCVKRREFAKLLHRLAAPPDAAIASLRTDETTICRCENIRTGALRATLRENPTITTSNALKLIARPGMGPCQGRFCHRAVQEEIIAQRNLSITDVGPFTARFPARPVALEMLTKDNSDD